MLNPDSSDEANDDESEGEFFTKEYFDKLD